MATWTNVLDSNLEPGDPIRSVDIIAIKDNTTALAEGASGAPEIYQKATQFSAKAQVFATAGSFTFTIPTGVVRLKVTVVGGGGGGAGAFGVFCPVAGGAGAGGGAAIKWLAVTGGTLSVTVGSGGAGGATNFNGSTGGTSSVASGTQSITTISATGGGGGGTNPTTNGSGGLGSNGDLNFRGQSPTLSNVGGITILGGFNFGTAATSYGGGSPGATSGNASNGAAGVVIFEW